MAWTSKSERFGGGSSPSAGAHIGPGHYKLSNSVRTAEHGYAPFGSTDPRSTSSKDARDGHGGVSPPPGAYDPKLPAAFDSGLPRKTVPFGVSATRIDMKAKPTQDFRPGPGTYKVDADREAPQQSRTMGIIPNDKPMLRSSSAPSIPQSHQSYGYEEVGGGRLVRQGPKDASLWCSGRPDNCAGPGHYEPSHEAMKPRQVSGAFLKGAARVPLDGAKNTPGPGHYTNKNGLEIETKSYLGGATFVSNSDRGPTKRQEQRSAEGPGPGTYAQGSTKKSDLRELRSELQYFQSTVERFKKAPGEKSCVADHVGPGTYISINRKAEPPNVRGFCSTNGRFKIDAVKDEKCPGPGSYEAAGLSDDTMGGAMATFSMLGNSGGLAFGAMNKRFTYGSDDKPGPGQYYMPGMSDEAVGDTAPIPEDSKGRPRWRKPTRPLGFAFASRTPKDHATKSNIKEGLQKPPPGAYDPVLVKDQATVVRLRSKSEGFLSGGERFQGGPLAAPKGSSQNVGPGKYSPEAVTGGKRVGTFNRSICEGVPESGRPKGLGFDSQDKRFRLTASTTKLPGPGQYNTDPRWITKSHNCYFGDLT